MTGVALTRAEAERLAGEVPKGGKWKSSLWTVPRGDITLLVKDVRYSAGAYRYTVGRLLLHWEARIYRHLEGLPFVPRFFGWLDGDALVIEQVEGVPLSGVGGAELDPAFYDRLGECLARLHERGVVHLDLRHRSNILVAPGGRPVLIDFASALYLGRGRLGRRLVPLAGWIDESGLLKYRLRDFPAGATEEDWRRFRRFRRLHLLWPFDRIYRKVRRRPDLPVDPAPKPGRDAGDI